MTPDASLFDELDFQEADAPDGSIDWAAMRASLEGDGIALTPPPLSEAECREA